jgi:tRNA modification GTPase
VHGVGGGAQGTGGDVQTELAAEELRLAADALGAVTGKVDVEEILDVVFADFCVGK